MFSLSPSFLGGQHPTCGFAKSPRFFDGLYLPTLGLVFKICCLMLVESLNMVESRKNDEKSWCTLHLIFWCALRCGSSLTPPFCHVLPPRNVDGNARTSWINMDRHPVKLVYWTAKSPTRRMFPVSNC